MITIIDYDLGNIGSIVNAFKKLGLITVVSKDSKTIVNSTAIILPGVGAAGEGMKNLNELGLINVIKDQITKGKPFLGICLGMQLLFEKSEEGRVECLGILKGKVIKFKKEKKIPQIGWNGIKLQNPKMKRSKEKEELLNQIEEDSYFYFVNSYYCEPEDKSIIAGNTIYGEEFASIILKNNIVATQFHPEKSQAAGLGLIRNFIRYSGR